MDVDPRQYENLAINDNDIQNIVLSYLIHNCYKESVESFIACTGMKQPADYLEDMEKRKRIFHFALDGNALKAIELTEQLAQDILEKNKDLRFDLLSLHFVELVRSRKCTEALEFAQSQLSPFGKEQKYMEKLEDFMALLAYKEPERSPMFHLLSLEYRQQVADSLNRAILGWLLDFLFGSMVLLFHGYTILFSFKIQYFISALPNIWCIVLISHFFLLKKNLWIMVFARTLKPSQLHGNGEAYTTSYSS
ncbi:glucose-induced degradation protein 8 homolog isoform X1 [Neltuma alba]|uniref:glucose-induced degradation protein 8 homolog isoform X1 n=1 Tax=Neltuma alba TaxID=207710 RepID=UPI0010A43154|nr:glucose-induced degradation protein 8 homolog isoform X1 [Prosopis alba]